MTRTVVLAGALFLGGCVQHRPLHDIGFLPAGQWAWCMTPGGEITGWSETRENGGGRCDAPNRFVLVPGCADGQSWHYEETSGLRAARARLGADGSLYGDRFDGLAFCAPMPPS